MFLKTGTICSLIFVTLWKPRDGAKLNLVLVTLKVRVRLALILLWGVSKHSLVPLLRTIGSPDHCQVALLS